MAGRRRRTTIAVPEEVVARATAAGHALGMRALNRVVEAALQQFAEAHEREIFAQEMARMATDPQIVAENARIAAEFRATEADGLPEQ